MLLHILHLRSSWCFLRGDSRCCEPELHWVESTSPGAFLLHNRAAQNRDNLFRYKCPHGVLEGRGVYADLIQHLSSHRANQPELKHNFA